MRWIVNIPSASAARLKNRKFVIEEHNIFNSEHYRFTIPEDAEMIHFDFEFENNDE